MRLNSIRRGAAPSLRYRACAAFALLTTWVAAGAATEEQQQIPAVLKLQTADFFYRTRIAPFTCIDLKGRVASIMRALGARDDVDVKVTGCDAILEPMATMESQDTGSGRWGTANNRWQTTTAPYGRYERSATEQSAHVRIRMMLPVPVTPEVLAEMEKDKSRRDLISRVTGNPAASFNDPIVFPAERREVTLSRRTVDLEADECELLEQMSNNLFRQLDMRVVSGRPNCDRDSISTMIPTMVVEALMPTMPSASAPAAPPAEKDAGDEAAESVEAPQAGETPQPDPAPETEAQGQPAEIPPG